VNCRWVASRGSGVLVWVRLRSAVLRLAVEWWVMQCREAIPERGWQPDRGRSRCSAMRRSGGRVCGRQYLGRAERERVSGEQGPCAGTGYCSKGAPESANMHCGEQCAESMSGAGKRVWRALSRAEGTGMAAESPEGSAQCQVCGVQSLVQGIGVVQVALRSAEWEGGREGRVHGVVRSMCRGPS
jgi:hypothetical protein